MHVDSYLEIFTTMYGWALANVISSLIVGTGLVVVPFFAIIFNKWRDAKEQGMQAGGIMSLLESAQTRLLVALFVATICFFHAPGVSLKNIDLIYKPRATYENPNPQEGSLNKGTSTSYDEAGKDAKNLDFIKDGSKDGLDKVPLWWYSVMAISAGINNAIRDGFKSQEDSVTMRELQTLALMAGVKQPELRDEIAYFTSFCHIPALAKYKQRPSGTKYTNEASNLRYPGNSFFMEEPGFYDSIQCTDCPRHVERYKNDSTRDTRPQSDGAADMNGMPMCKQWWNDIYKDVIEKNPGTKELADELASTPAGNPDRYMGVYAGQDPTAGVDEQAKAVAMQIALANSEQFFDYGNFYGANNGSNLLADTAANLGNLENRLKSAVLKSVLTSTLPIVQALLLMGVYAFLPLMIFLSGFDLRAMFIGSVALFSVKIFAALWMVAHWMDTKLVDAMHPKGEFGLAAQGIGAQATFANGFKETVLSTLLVMLFVGLPMLWISMLGWISIRISTALQHMLNAGNASAMAAGAMGYSRAGQVAGTVLSGPASAGRKAIGGAVSNATSAIARRLS